MNLRTRIASGIVAAVSALALIAATAPAAEAGGATKGNGTLPSRCSGSKVGEKKKGKFHLEVYYSSANGGTNCAIFYNNTGQQQLLNLKISSLDGRNLAEDNDFYYKYAGPVAIRGTKGKCINVVARTVEMPFFDDSEVLELSFRKAFCG